MRLFFHLILKANVEDHGFENITIHRGELATSYPSLSEELGLSIKSLRTALNHLKWTGEVAVKTYPKFSVISIVCYDKYQGKGAVKTAGNGQSTGSQGAGNGQQYNNDRSKEVKKESGSPTANEPKRVFHDGMSSYHEFGI